MSADADKLREVFSEALAIASSEERDRFLAEVCGQNADLRHQVDSLLSAHAEAGEFLRQNVIVSNGPAIGEKPGDIIGRYKLLQQIGEGGFGVVFMAEQQEPVRRLVALKIIKAGMDTKEVVARFEAERQALALMDHPNLARVLDGGATASGRPYFVMDLVKGIPITEFCERHQLPIEARLRLFMQVCAGVQHAHQKGVIHRDLKPNNVLVIHEPGQPGVPKVIDFGIAKAIGQKLTERTLFTRFEQLIGTPAYMSPEQAEWSGLDVDTRSDLYSLGVLLYELLTATTPLAKETLARATLDEVRRMIRETEPPKPSTRLKQTTAVASTKTRSQTESAIRNPQSVIDSDLDWIVMRALEKDRARRYETVNGLARDVERHLNGEPVVARPPSKAYLAGKFIRKHRTAVTATALMGLALLTGLMLALLGLRQAQHERKRAEGEAAKAQELAKVLTDMLEGASPEIAKGRDTTILREILDRTAVQVRRQLTNEPEVQIEALGTLANVYEELQLYDQMEAVARESAAIAKAKLGEASVPYADSLEGIGRALLDLGDLEQSEAYLRTAVALQAKLSGTNGPRTAALRDSLGEVLMARHKWDEAQSLYRDLLAEQPRTGLDRAELLNNLAIVLKNEGRMVEAERLQRESVALSRQSGKEDLNTLAELQNLGSQMDQEQRLAEAETFYRDALELSRRLWGKDNSKLAPTALSLVDLLAREKKYAEAEKLFHELLDNGKARRPEDAPLLAGRAEFLAKRSLWKEAVTNLCEAIRLQPTNASQYATLANVLAGNGEISAYRLLNPLITTSAPPTTAALLASHPSALSWQTIADTNAGVGLKQRPLTLALDPTDGLLYCAGWAMVGSRAREAAKIWVSCDSGTTWTTLDQWQLDNWPFAGYRGFSLASNGVLFAGGQASDKASGTATIDWMVRRSTDGGVTWTVQDLVDSGTGGKAQCMAIRAAPWGDVYAAGLTATNQGAGGWVWLVRKSSDSGATWKTVDSICDRDLKEAEAIGFGPQDSVFVVGRLHGSFFNNASVWTVRRSTDRGATWTTVDSYQTAPGLAAEACAIVADSTGAIYVAGKAKGRTPSGGKLTDQWIVRRSTDEGETWSDVDNLAVDTRKTDRYAEKFSGLSGPTGIAVLPSGAIVVCGYMTALDGALHWLVRRGIIRPNGAMSWSTIDNYQLAPDQSARANCVACDSAGDICVAGRAADRAGVEHFIVRRLKHRVRSKASRSGPQAQEDF